MVRALFDTNIVIDLLNSVPAALAEIERSAVIAISVMSWMEVLVGIDPAVEAKTRATLSMFDLVMVDAPIMERAVAIRRESRIKLIDAVIWATAQTREMLLVTRNTKDFPVGAPGVRMPYAV